MQQLIDTLLGAYESGAISRRHLIHALGAVAAGAQAVPAAATPFQGVELNHIALRVADVPRSRDFYKNLLGLPVLSDSASSCFLGIGRHFLALFRNASLGLDHYCIAIRDYHVGPVTEELKRLGLNPDQPAGTQRVYFKDPDGITVQFSASDHRP